MAEEKKGIKIKLLLLLRNYLIGELGKWVIFKWMFNCLSHDVRVRHINRVMNAMFRLLYSQSSSCDKVKSLKSFFSQNNDSVWFHFQYWMKSKNWLTFPQKSHLHRTSWGECELQYKNKLNENIGTYITLPEYHSKSLGEEVFQLSI